jgi:pyruvate kinase
MSDAPTVDVTRVAKELAELRAALVRAEDHMARSIARVHPRHRASARNLVHYVALRRHDVRELQVELAELGLSSLGRLESNVLASVDRVLRVVCTLGGLPAPEPVRMPEGLQDGRSLLADNAQALFGPPPPGRSTRILVTMPSTAAGDPDLVQQMVAAGMDLARVNCAHDDEAAWRRMIGHIRRAGTAAGRTVPVAMDLAGPKLRTGPVEPGPRVMRVAPVRDASGVVMEPATVLLTAVESGAPGMTTVTIGDGGWAERRQPGDVVQLVDTRGARRRLPVLAVADGGCLVEVQETTYFGSGVLLRVERDGAASDTTEVGELPELEQALVLRPGDELVLTRDLSPAPVPRPGMVATGRQRIGCTLPEAFSAVEPGHRVLLDDGKIGGDVTEVSPDEMVVRITDAARGGTRLKAEKGINLPDSRIRIPALTAKDVADLPFVVDHADLVSLSFVREADDVELLQEQLHRLGGTHLGIVLKIETVPAFEHLPDLLLTAMQSERVGVMIARGDLAVETGYERLAEVQEEILWLCEAGHVPVIWATQVLDTLARKGRPSRAEVSDAAMAERAECVMLNKGPYIVTAIETLAGILERMTGHQSKKSALLRELRSWTRAIS